MSAAPVVLAKCTRCDAPSEILECRDCSFEMWTPDDCGEEQGRDAELEDVLEFFKQLEVDSLRCGQSVNLADIAARLERGEHRA